MDFKETKIKGLYIIDLKPYSDERGFFARNFCKQEFAKAGIDFDIVQANLSLTKKKGTIRGLHFQSQPKAEDKIVQCLRGTIYDVAVDLRKDSQTFGQWVAQELSAENKKMFLIPKGFAHGFQVLEEDCLLQYFMSEFYSAELSFGVRWDDPFLGIQWPIANPFLSEKDKNWPLIKKT
jgi:dTDP-4-dehydrorhamnose 3,5-epimerase